MGRLKKADKEKVHKNISNAKELLGEVKMSNEVDMGEIFNLIRPENNEIEEYEDEELVQHVPIHKLKEIREKMGEKKEIYNPETDKTEIVPKFSEDEKIKLVFSMLSEKGLNLLDYLEGVLAEAGYDGKVVFSINETFDKVTNVLKDISEMQYNKSKLDLEQQHINIQKYKADLKLREIELKEKAQDDNPSTQNIIAVGSPSELLEILDKNKKGTQEVEVTEVDEDLEEISEEEEKIYDEPISDDDDTRIIER